MTSTNISINEKNAEKRYGIRKYIGFRISSTKGTFILMLILMFAFMLFPAALYVAGAERVHDIELYNELYNGLLESRAQSAAGGYSLIGFLLTGLLSLIAGRNCLSYVNDKKGVDCFHSLPIKRSSLFFVDTAVFWVYSFVASTAGYLLTYFLLSANIQFFPLYAKDYLVYWFAAQIFFLIIYSVKIFAAGLSGTKFMRGFLSVLIIIGSMFFFALFFSMFLIADGSLDFGYYFGGKVTNLFSWSRLILNMTKWEQSGVLPFLLSLPEVVIFYILGYFLHVHRKSERTGNTIIWKPVFEVVKYLIVSFAGMIGIAAACISTWGSEETYSIFMMIISAVIAGFIAFILCNAILFKSTKSMFVGLFPGFAFFCAAAAVFVFLVPANIFGFVGKPYPQINTSRVAVELRDYRLPEEILPDSANYPVSYKSGEIQDRLLANMKNGIDMSESRYSYNLDSHSFFVNRIVQYPKVGFPLAKNPRAIDCDTAAMITRSDEFVETMNSADWSKLDKDTRSNLRMRVFLLGKYVNVGDDGEKSDYSYESRFVDELLPYLSFNNEYRSSSPLIGYVEIYCNSFASGTIDMTYPIYAADRELIGAIISCGFDLAESGILLEEAELYGDSTRAICHLVAQETEFIILVDTKTGENVCINDKELIEELYTKSANLPGESTHELMDAADVHYYIYIGECYEDTDLYFRYGKGTAVYFRDGAITNAELEAIFNANK